MEKEKRKHSEPRRNIFMMILRFIASIFSGIGSGVWWLLSNGAIAIWFVLKKLGTALGWSFENVASFAYWLIKQPYHLLRYIISGRIPDFENARQEEIFWRIKRQFRRKRLFLINTLLYGAHFIIQLFIIGDSYLRWQRAIELGWNNPASYLSYFYGTLYSSGLMVGIWTLLLIFHFVFNKMGDAEDKALGEALAPEYARSDAEERYYNANMQRLEDSHDDHDYYEIEKPKKNGARL